MSSGWRSLARILMASGVMGLVTIPALVSADSGGAGIRFGTITTIPEYSDDDDEEDEAPSGFSSSYTLGYGLSAKFDLGVTYDLKPNEDEPDVELGGPSLSEDETTYLTPRFSYRFPGTYAPVPSDSGSAGVDIQTTFMTQTWASEPVVEQLSLEERIGRMRENAENLSQVERLAIFFGITTERAEKMMRDLDEWASHAQAEQFLGSEAYDKLQAEYGRAPKLATGQGSESRFGAALATPNGLGAAEDHSAWNETFLYCGGACVPSAF